MTWVWETEEVAQKVLSSKRTQDVEFWRERIRHAKHNRMDIGQAVNNGFDYTIIDPVHEEIINQFVKPSDSVLEVGCGIGRSASFFPVSGYLGLDFVPEFVDEAKKRNPTRRFEVYDMTRLPLPFSDKAFDLVVGVSFQVVVKPVIGDQAWEALLTELKRVSKRGVLFVEFANHNPEEMRKFSYYEA